MGAGQLSQAQPRSAPAAASGGLSTEEAQRRLAQYGENAIHAVRVSALRKLLSYFWGPIPWMIEVAAVLSAAAQNWEDFAIIAALLLINAAVGFWEEHKADDAIEALKRRLARAPWCCAMGPGRAFPPRCWCPTTWCSCAWATPCRRTPS